MRSSERISTVPKIETDRLLLRQWREKDFEPYARICADPEVMRYMSADGSPRTRQETRKLVTKIVRHWEDRGFGLWAVEEKTSGRFIGRIGLQYHEDWTAGGHKVEVGWLLDRASWGQGLATEGACESLRYGFEELKLGQIISIALPDNSASQRVMEKCRLTPRGDTHWKGLDVVWYAIDRDEWEAGRSPAAVLPS